MERKTVEVVAAVIIKDGLAFVTQRGYGKFKDGWEFPGGKVEKDETWEEALKREIREELDTEITIDKIIRTIEYDYSDFHLILHCFKCALSGKAPVLLEHESAKWVKREEIDALGWLPADLQILEDIKNLL